MSVLYSQYGTIVKPTNNVLPEGFKRIEYIDNPTTNGRGCFKLPFQKNISSIEKVLVECALNNNSGRFIFTGYINRPDAYTRFNIQLYGNNNALNLDIYGGNATSVTFPNNFAKNEKFSIVYENKKIKIEDKNGLTAQSSEAPFSTDFWIDSFIIGNELSNTTAEFFNGKIYSVYIKATDDEELNLLPIKNSNGLVGFWCKQRNYCFVNEWNSNNGLVAGPEI